MQYHFSSTRSQLGRIRRQKPATAYVRRLSRWHYVSTSLDGIRFYDPQRLSGKLRARGDLRDAVMQTALKGRVRFVVEAMDSFKDPLYKDGRLVEASGDTRPPKEGSALNFTNRLRFSVQFRWLAPNTAVIEEVTLIEGKEAVPTPEKANGQKHLEARNQSSTGAPDPVDLDTVDLDDPLAGIEFEVRMDLGPGAGSPAPA